MRGEALKTLGRRIAELRREKDFTREALAEAMGVSRNHIADIELGCGMPGLESAADLWCARRCPR